MIPTTIADLTADPRNPREMDDESASGLRASISRFGDISGITFNVRTKTLIAGHQRISQLAELYGGDLAIEPPEQGSDRGFIECPNGDRFAIRFVDWDDDAHMAANVAANNPFVSGRFTDGIAEVLGELQSSIGESFAALRFDALTELECPAISDDDDELTIDDLPTGPGGLLDKWPVKQGDVWEITGSGVHRVMCGDCRSPDELKELIDGATVDGIFTSPPYANQRQDDYGGIATAEYLEWWSAVQGNMKRYLSDRGVFCVNIKPHCEDGERATYVMELVIAMKHRWGWRYVDEMAWVHGGTPGKPSRRFKNQFEPIHIFAKGEWAFYPDSVKFASDGYFKPQARSNVSRSQGKGGSTLDGVQTMRGMVYPGNVIRTGHNREALGHSAAFPVDLPVFAMKAYSDKSSTWLDPFLGSGTSMVAAEKHDRSCYGMEIEPRYCAIVLQRMSDLGCNAVKIKGTANVER